MNVAQKLYIHTHTHTYSTRKGGRRQCILYLLFLLSRRFLFPRYSQHLLRWCWRGVMRRAGGIVRLYKIIAVSHGGRGGEGVVFKSADKLAAPTNAAGIGERREWRIMIRDTGLFVTTQSTGREETTNTWRRGKRDRVGGGRVRQREGAEREGLLLR